MTAFYKHLQDPAEDYPARACDPNRANPEERDGSDTTADANEVVCDTCLEIIKSNNPARTAFDWRLQKSDIVGPVEVADRLGVKIKTVDAWRDREVIPPADHVVGNGKPLWSWSRTIEPWAIRTHRIEELEAVHSDTVRRVIYEVPDEGSAEPITVEHGLNTMYPSVSAFDVLGKQTFHVLIEVSDPNTVQVTGGHYQLDHSDGMWVYEKITKIVVVG